MIKHVVAWTFADQAQGRTKQENVELVASRLESLTGIVDGIRTLEVVRPERAIQSTLDLMLYSEFDDEAALRAYAQHPEHQEVIALVQSVVSNRAVADYDPSQLSGRAG